MKYHFFFNGKSYLAESKKDAMDFIKFWDSPFTRVVAYVPVPLILDQIEYSTKMKPNQPP